MPRCLALVALLAAIVPGAPSAARDAGADGRFDERESRHFLLREDVAIDQHTGPHGSNQFERDVLRTLEVGYAALDDALGLRPPRRIEVEIYDPAIFDAQFAALLPFPAAGFYGGTIRVRGDVAVTPRLESTLHHELLHAALDAAAPSLAVPAWLNEGLAEWFAARVDGRPAFGRAHRAMLQRAAAQGALLPIDAISQPTLTRLAPADAPVAYLEATALVDEIDRRGGERALRTLLEHYLRTGDLDRALERAIRLDVRGLEAATAASLGL